MEPVPSAAMSTLSVPTSWPSTRILTCALTGAVSSGSGTLESVMPNVATAAFSLTSAVFTVTWVVSSPSTLMSVTLAVADAPGLKSS